MVLPDVGRWIKISYKNSDFEIKAKILSHEECEGSQWDSFSGFQNTVDKYAEIRYDDGTLDNMDEADFNRSDWSYIDAPGEAELKAAEDQSFNRAMGGFSCGSCGCDTKKLMQCSQCHNVFYCDANCQRAHWAAHRQDCKREKVVLRPNKRYPLSHPSSELAATQAEVQEENSKLLQAALAGRFTVDDGERTVENPKAGEDLECLERYELFICGKEFHLKWRGLCPKGHSIPEGIPTACDMFLYMEMMEENMKQGGLHYMASAEVLDGGHETFWYMLINFNTFGTVAPFHAPCRCNPSNKEGQMPPKLRELRSRWDEMFIRAKADPHDVQCMFADTQVGCHNFGKCPFKHDVEVTKSKKTQA